MPIFSPPSEETSRLASGLRMPRERLARVAAVPAITDSTDRKGWVASRRSPPFNYARARPFTVDLRKLRRLILWKEESTWLKRHR